MQKFRSKQWLIQWVGRELLESGFKVRAGVRDVARGQALLEVCYFCL